MSLLFALFFSAFVINVHSQNLTEEKCIEEVNTLAMQLLSPTSFLEKVEVYPDDLEYILFTNNHPSEEIRIIDSTKHLIDPKLETKVLISGWLEKHNTKWILDFRSIYLQKGPYNIIVFNWDEYADMHYIFSTELCMKLGKELGDFLVDLNKNVGLNLNRIHVIGYSLGAQIAGFTGQRIMKRLYRRIGRISALDAAGPIFNFNTESYRLDKNDANFVDAIHTNNFVFGYKGPLGTVDVFVNNAVFQPGCPTINDLMQTSRTCSDIHTFLFCSHAKSINVWKESININLIARHIVTGYPLVVGENTPRNSSGFYSLVGKF